jgi:hypothetical protein
MNLSPFGIGSPILAIHRTISQRVAELQDQQQATANNEKNGLFLFRMHGAVSLLYCERSAAPSRRARPPQQGDRLTRLARRPATIDRHDVSGNVRGPLRAGLAACLDFCLSLLGEMTGGVVPGPNLAHPRLLRCTARLRQGTARMQPAPAWRIERTWYLALKQHTPAPSLDSTVRHRCCREQRLGIGMQWCGI